MREIFDGAFLELGDAHPRVIRLHHLHTYRLGADLRPRDGDRECAAFILAPDGQCHLRVGLAAHAFYRIGDRHAAHGLVVDARDQVASFESCLVCRRVFDGGNDFDQPVFLADFNPDSDKLAAGFFLEFLESFFVVVL